MRNLTQKSTALRLARFGTLLALMGALTACQTMQATMETPEKEKKAEVIPPAVEPIPVRSARASMIAPIVETRETITATGYAVVSIQNHKTPAQKRLRKSHSPGVVFAGPMEPASVKIRKYPSNGAKRRI